LNSWRIKKALPPTAAHYQCGLNGLGSSSPAPCIAADVRDKRKKDTTTPINENF